MNALRSDSRSVGRVQLASYRVLATRPPFCYGGLNGKPMQSGVGGAVAKHELLDPDKPGTANESASR